MIRPSDNPSDYVLDQNSHKRYTAREQGSRRAYVLKLLKAFDCRCAVCQADDNGVELDHFFIPKCRGGDFVLTEAATKRKRLNAVPLCMTCNRDKSQRPASDWLSQEQIDSIWQKARHLDAEISGVSVSDTPVVAPAVQPVVQAPPRSDKEAFRAYIAQRAAERSREKRRIREEQERKMIEAEKIRIKQRMETDEITRRACVELGVPVPKRRSKAGGRL